MVDHFIEYTVYSRLTISGLSAEACYPRIGHEVKNNPHKPSRPHNMRTRARRLDSLFCSSAHISISLKIV